MLTVPIQPQLVRMLQSHNLLSLFDKTAKGKGIISTVQDGSMYRSGANADFLRNPNNFSISWSCDGVPVFKSSHYSIWPLFCSINELPLQDRRKFIILTALWFGPTKPRMDTFLKCFVEEMTELFHEGFKWSNNGFETISKVITLTCVCDAPARALVQNFVKYNGFYGCGFCKHSGESVAKGNGRATVYPVRAELPERRSHAETIVHAQCATGKGKPECGVKGATMAMLIPQFDIIIGFIPDYMHAVLLGVVRSFVELWLDSSNHDKPYYIRDVKLIDARLSAIKPPREIRRKPRSIGERKYWKAAEWRSFLLLYSHLVLKDILPASYFKHWMLLVFALNLLIGNDITKDNILKAKLALNKFGVLTESLYGIENVSYNVHIIQHLPTSVEEWGPITYHSAFLFEDASGMLLKMFGGTQCVPQQIIKYYHAMRKLQTVARAWLSGADEQTCAVFDQLTRADVTFLLQKSVTFNSCTVLGAHSACKLSALENAVVENLLTCRPIFGRSFLFHERLVYKDKLYTTVGYSKQLKQNNSVCRLRSAEFCQIISFVILRVNDLHHFVNCTCKDEILCFVKPFRKSNPQPQCFDTFVEVNLNHFVIKCVLDPTADIFAVRATDIAEKCFAYEANDAHFVSVLPNFELD